MRDCQEGEMDKHTFSYEHNGSEVVWDVRDIWKAVEGLPSRKIKTSILKQGSDIVFKQYTDDDYERSDEADLKYPIIISAITVKGRYLIIDGYHRLYRHIELKHDLIDVVELDRMPRPLYCKGKPFKIPGLEFTWYDPRKVKDG